MVLFDKIKIGIIILSMIILVTIPIVKNSFYQTPIISKWKTLTWDDFKGIPKPFSGWGAVISSTIYLKYDSTTNSHNAYAAQNNLHSWTKTFSKSGLRHEQYHFNISEVHARKLNQYIKHNPNLTSDKYYEKLHELRNDLAEMQNQYDDDSDHSLVKDQQALWEYRVDSMLLSYSEKSGFQSDPFSNATAFFPSKPTLHVYSEHQSNNRNYALGTLYFKLQLKSISAATPIDIDYLKESLRNDSTTLGFNTSHVQNQIRFFEVDSTTGIQVDHLLSFNGYHVVELMFSHAVKDSLGGYQKIKNSFFQSFTLQDQRDYWNTSSEDVKPQELSLSRALKKEDKAYESGACTVRWFEKPYGFYGVPYRDSSSNINIPYQFIADSIQEIQYGLVKYGDNFIYSKPDSIFHLFTIPNDLVDPEVSEFSIGYTLFKDSIEVCEQNYAQLLDVSSLFN